MDNELPPIQDSPALPPSADCMAGSGEAIPPESPRAEDLDTRATSEMLRRQAELALLESEQRFARFMRHLPGLAWIKDVQGRYIYANDAALKAFRTGRDDLYGKLDQELFPSDVAEQFRENDRRALASETGIQTVETLEHDDGLIHHSIVSKFPIPGGDDQAALVGGMAVDITELIRAEAAIRESEERFRGLTEAIPQMVYVATAEGDIEYLSQRWREFTGMTQADEASMREVIHPDDYSLMNDRWIAAAALAAPFEAEIRIRGASDGVFRWFLTRALPIRGGNGDVTKWFGTCTDINGQKRAEQGQHILAEAGRILSSSLDYQATLANVCKLVVPIIADWCSLELFGEDGRLQYREVAHTDPAKLELAREYRRLYPARPDDRVGVMRVFRTGEPEFFGEVTDELLTMGARDQEELRRLLELGLRSVMIVPLTARGRTLGALTLVTAESSRRYGEDDLHLALELGSRAALAVDNVRLVEELRANDRRKDEFLAMLAHELRNPLAAIDNAVSLIGFADPGREKVEWSVDVIGRHVKHLTRLIDDLLDVSRITRGKIQLRKTRIDACPVLNSAIESVRSLLEKRQHRLTTIYGTDLMLDADATRLEQIAVNLLSNAAKYTESHGQIGFSARRERNQIVIRVRDTGVGMTPEQISSVFDPFVQGDHSLARTAGGLGIGLTLVRKLTELHGGTVMARSEGPGKGSEFTVRLPAASETVSEASSPPAQPHPTTRRPARVLVVDDNVDLARGLARLLEIHGHHVQIAYDGPAGLDNAKEWRPEFVLLDIGLPGMDGYQVASLLRRDPNTKDAVIIAISGYGQEEDHNRSIQAGFDHHLVKPVSSSDLIKVLDNPR
jgi:PAS domain S-box-containing protein